MSTNVRDAKSGSTFPPMEPGTYPATCCGVIDLGLQKTTFEGIEREVNQILITWEFPDELLEINGEMKPRRISNTYTFSTSEKAKLRKDLKTWRGRDFTEAELRDFDIANILGAPCLVNIVNVSRNGNTYANMAGCVKLPKGMTVPQPSVKMHFDIDDRGTWGVFADLPEWIRAKINNGLTFAEKGIRLDKNGKVFDFSATVPNDHPAIDGIAESIDDNEELPF